MRLSVFIADTLSTQLTIDLQKIYLNLLPEQLLTTQALAPELADSASQWFVTMFNERHIGAVKVHKTDNHAALSQLCIRDITRRRGVGKNLLREVEKSLISQGVNKIQYDLQEVSKDELLATHAFLLDCNYIITDKLATKLI